MARVNSTTKETDNNFNVANGTGALVRAGINDIFTALRTINSASGDPSGAGNVVKQFQPRAVQHWSRTQAELLVLRLP